MNTKMSTTDSTNTLNFVDCSYEHALQDGRLDEIMMHADILESKIRYLKMLEGRGHSLKEIIEAYEAGRQVLTRLVIEKTIENEGTI